MVVAISEDEDVELYHEIEGVEAADAFGFAQSGTLRGWR
jgi:hypothetical protein